MIDADFILQQASGCGTTLHIDLWYPSVEETPIKKIQIGLQDVLAADDIRVSYCYKRDGWVVEQERIETKDGEYYSAGEWVEVAFVKAWGQEKDLSGDDHE